MVKGIVVYSTRFGNTKGAAESICQGIREGGIDVDCKNMNEVKPENLVQYDLILFGAPTHADDIPHEMKPFMDALRGLNLKGKKAAAFDTRYEDAETGALNVLEDYMRKFGMSIIMPGIPVLLPPTAARGPLLEGESTKCKQFGRTVADKASTV